MISFISPLEAFVIVIPDPNIFLWKLCISYASVAAAAAAAAAVNLISIKILLANRLSTFPIKCNPHFSNGPKV